MGSPKTRRRQEARKRQAARAGITAAKLKRQKLAARKKKSDGFADGDTKPNWNSNCSNCGEAPVLPVTGLCGPCTFGEADTIGGNW